MPATSPPDPQLRIFAATMRAVRGPAEQPAPEARLAAEGIEDKTVEIPRFTDFSSLTAPPTVGPPTAGPSTPGPSATGRPTQAARPTPPAPLLAPRGRHRMG